MTQRESILQHLKSKGVTIRYNLFNTPKMTYPDDECLFLIYSLSPIRKGEWKKVLPSQGDEVIGVNTVYPQVKVEV